MDIDSPLDQYPTCVSVGTLEEAKQLIESQGEHILCPEGRSVLFYAVQRIDGNEAVELSRFLLETRNFATDAEDVWGQTPLFHAAREGHVQCLRLLVDDFDFDVCHEDKAKQTALFYACREGRTDAVDWLVQRGADVNHIDLNGDTPLFYAARDNREETIGTMLDLGANPSYRNPAKLYASSIARRMGHRRVAQLLDTAKRARDRQPRRPVKTAQPESDDAISENTPQRQRPLRRSRSVALSKRKRGTTSDHEQPAKSKRVSSPSPTKKPSTTSTETLAEPDPSPAVELVVTDTAECIEIAAVAESVNRETETIARQTPSSSPILSPVWASIGSGGPPSRDPELVTSPAPASQVPLKREVYSLQHLTYGDRWTFASPTKVKSFETLFPDLAVWDKSRAFTTVGARDDPHRAYWHDLAAQLVRYLSEDVEKGAYFREPVDTKKWKVPDYFEVIRNPMDLKTIGIKLEVGVEYTCISDFMNDLSQIFTNCLLYNNPDSLMGKVALEVQELAQAYAARIGLQAMHEYEVAEKQDSARIRSSSDEGTVKIEAANLGFIPASPTYCDNSSPPFDNPLLDSCGASGLTSKNDTTPFGEMSNSSVCEAVLATLTEPKPEEMVTTASSSEEANESPETKDSIFPNCAHRGPADRISDSVDSSTRGSSKQENNDVSTTVETDVDGRSVSLLAM